MKSPGKRLGPCRLPPRGAPPRQPPPRRAPLPLSSMLHHLRHNPRCRPSRLPRRSISGDGYSMNINKGSDFMGTKFTIYARQQPYEGAKTLSSGSGRWFASKQISPLVSYGNFEVGQVSYEYNLRRSRGPRRIRCSIQCLINEGTAIDTQEAKQLSTPSSLVLNNKVPRWHEHLQCWCLKFHGRVVVASVKNFQPTAPARTGEPWGVQDDETVILQFGKFDDRFYNELPAASVGIPGVRYLPHQFA